MSLSSQRIARVLFATALASVALGCDSESSTTADAAAAPADAVTASETTPVADVTAPSDATPTPDTTTTTDAPGTDTAGTGAAVPTTAAELFAWLQAGSYSGWDAESAPHSSQGPHGTVQTYVNAQLAGSLAAGASTHPMGSAAVKELYTNGALGGWAVEVKVQADSAGGAGWYWYEVFSATDGSSPAVDGTGVAGCTGCHSGGSDYVTTGWPLQ